MINKFKVHPNLQPHPRLHPYPGISVLKTVGIIIECEKHDRIFKGYTTEADNGYIWYSQLEGKEYYFYEGEILDGEILK